MRVLVTGAGGFVGGHLAVGLARLGFEAVLADRVFDAPSKRRFAGHALFEGELGDLLEHAPPVDYLIHAAAVTADPEEVGESAGAHLAGNVSATLTALRLAERLKVKRFVFVSSAGVFSAQNTQKLDEHTPPDALGPYAAAKRMGELAAASLREMGKLDAVSVRLGNLYGPDERARPTRPRVSLLQRLVDEAHGGSVTVAHPEAKREWTLVTDLAPAFAALLTRAELPSPVLHLCAESTESAVSVVSDLELAGLVLARFPGAQLRVHPTSSPGPRAPLESLYAAALGLPTWTPLERGLTELLREVSA